MSDFATELTGEEKIMIETESFSDKGVDLARIGLHHGHGGPSSPPEKAQRPLIVRSTGTPSTLCKNSLQRYHASDFGNKIPPGDRARAAEGEAGRGAHEVHAGVHNRTTNSGRRSLKALAGLHRRSPQQPITAASEGEERSWCKSTHDHGKTGPTKILVCQPKATRGEAALEVRRQVLEVRKVVTPRRMPRAYPGEGHPVLALRKPGA